MRTNIDDMVKLHSPKQGRQIVTPTKLDHSKPNEKIDYVEFPSKNLDGTKAFFAQVFGWTFEDFGPDYSAFSNQGLDGGFFRSELNSTTAAGSALIVFYSHDLEATRDKIVHGGGHIIKPIFPFPGGRRFHFADPGDNEFAVWSDVDI